MPGRHAVTHSYVHTNTFASIVGGWVHASFPVSPKFVRRRKPDAEFEAVLRAPKGSRAGYLAIHTWHGDLWVRFNPPRMSYPVESRREMALIVRQLLGDRALFVVTYFGDAWRGTTLIRRNVVPKLRRGEVAHVVSWSGHFDMTVEASQARGQSASRGGDRRPDKRLQPTARTSIVSSKPGGRG
jgi:hypothetical protein